MLPGLLSCVVMVFLLVDVGPTTTGAKHLTILKFEEPTACNVHYYYSDTGKVLGKVDLIISYIFITESEEDPQYKISEILNTLYLDLVRVNLDMERKRP